MMKNKLLKGSLACLVAAVITMTNIFPVEHVLAQESRSIVNVIDGMVDFEKGQASIRITGNEGQTLAGKTFYVYKLFHAENSEGLESINYTFNEEYQLALQTVVGEKIAKPAQEVTEYEVIDYIQSLNSNTIEGAQSTQEKEGSYSSFRYFVEELRDEIEKQGMSGDEINVVSVDANNTVTISGLEYGYYIIDEVTNVYDAYSAASLCMVSTANPAAVINIKSDYPYIIKKIQEDDNQQMLGNDGWNDIGDYEVGQTVPYKYESSVPDMNGYDTYYYAWHDIMDEALTFHADTVSIEIVQNESGSIQAKTYTLDANEFQITENTGEGETFKIEISDIKAIIDREFNHKNAAGENIYGQTVVLRYNATLNDKAADITKQLGFENDVRLEFSNDPDHDKNGSTGYTPWDTVVCFTYRLNVLKTNDKGAELENAKFRLYSDADCTQEVYVKQGADGYIVMNRDSVQEETSTEQTVPEEAVEMVTGQEGKFTIYGLDSGIYYLKETKAPLGYRALLDPIVLNVSPTFKEQRNAYVKGEAMANQTLLSLEAKAHIKEFLEGAYEEQDVDLQTNINDGSVNVTVINTVGSKLPVTGSSMMIILIGLGIVLMWYAVTGKKKEEHK